MFEIVENPKWCESRRSHSPDFLVNPQPVNGDASFGVPLGYQRHSRNEHRPGVGLDKDAPQLLPLMLSRARLSARAVVHGANQ